MKKEIIDMIPVTAISPGEHLCNVLKSLSITSMDFAKEAGLEIDYVNGVIDGDDNITEELMVAAKKKLNIIPSTWANLLRKQKEEVELMKKKYLEICTPEKPKFLIVKDNANAEYIFCTAPITLFWLYSYDPLQIIYINGPLNNGPLENKKLLVDCHEWYREFTKLDILNIKLSELDLSTRCYNALTNNNIYTIRDVKKHTEAELLSLIGFGKSCLKEIEFKFSQFGV